MGDFTPELAASYLLAFAAWAASLLVAGIRYGGTEIVTTPAQGVQLVATFGAAALIARTAWLLTRESGPPATPLSPSPLLWLLLGTTIR